MHAWTEPAERVLKKVAEMGVKVAITRPVKSVEPANPPDIKRWWSSIAWKTADDSPIVSSGVEKLQLNIGKPKILIGD